jgi:CheY-like chemotaxis protein
MFAQVDSALGRSQGGLGIGLALSRSLVELHGGTIEARSNGVGQGSEFMVRLPVLAMPERSLVRIASKRDEPADARRVLVVDDVEDNVESLVALLSFDGHAIETARDGLEAVAKAERFRPDAILLDLGLPKLTGLEACRRIRAQPWGRGMLIVALTGWGQDSDRERTSAAGFDAHFVKPVAYEDLRRILSGSVAA